MDNKYPRPRLLRFKMRLVPALSLWILGAMCLQPLLSDNPPVNSYRALLSRKSDQSVPVISRFKSLDRVINRLDSGYQSSLKVSGDGSSSYKGKYGDLLTSGLQTEGKRIPETVAHVDDDLDDDDEGDSYEDDNDGELNDNTPQWNYSYKNGAYRPPSTSATTSTTTTTTTAAPPQTLSYSQMKWRDLGTRQAVEQTRMRHSYGQSQHHMSRSPYTSNGSSMNGASTTQTQGQSSARGHGQQPTPDTSIREAINHALKVSREGSCKIPKPRLVRVQDYYPHPGKTYVPHCTILHQCSDDTGCCRHDVLTCSPRTTQRVELYFYSILADNNRASSVERLVFYNHTECECRDKMEDIMPRDDTIPHLTPPTTAGAPISNVVSGLPARLSSSTSGPSTRVEKNLNALQCKCPSMFTERVLPDGACTCDCFDKQRECLLLKRGTDFFTMQDKWCIQSGRCEIPGCSYGSYIHLVGRCPRKTERSGQSLSWHRYLTQ